MARETNRGALAGRILNEQYVLIGLLGVGGMAEVYHGDDLALERDLAVKVLPSGSSDDPALVARFRDEARRVAALNHPRVVPIYHLGADDGLLYIVMPLMRGSLRDLLRQEGTLSPAEAARLVGQVAEALEAAHAAGLVHRDVKPENILLDADGNANLSDFGIARSVTDGGAIPTLPSLANGDIPAGTPHYMAPEQIAGEPLDQRADVYGLAAVLYEMLAGEPPHGLGPLHEVIGRAIAGGIPPLGPRAPGVWPQLEAVVAKGLATDRTHRYQTVRDFSQALRAAMDAQGQHTIVQADRAALPTMPATHLASATSFPPDASTIPVSLGTNTRSPHDVPRPRIRLVVAVAIFVILALLTTASGIYYLASTNAGRDHAGSGGTAGSTTTAYAASTPTRGIASPAATSSVASATASATPATPTASPNQTPTDGQLTVSPTSANARCDGTAWPPITLGNTGQHPINWQGQSLTLTVSISPSSGTLGPNGTQQVTLQGAALPGTTVTIKFTGNGPTRTVTITCQ